MRAEARSHLCIAVAPLSDTVATQTLWNLGVDGEEQLATFLADPKGLGS